MVATLEARSMRYVRLHAGPDGESHFEDVDVVFEAVDYAPPAPPLHLSGFVPATRVGFVAPSSDWQGDWHPTPLRQFFAYLSGGAGVEASDGEIRHFRAGDVLFVEDTTGKGHRSWSETEEESLVVVVHVPD
jgi:hypothetical protein